MPPSTTVKLPPQLVRQLRTFRRRLRTVKMLEAVCLAGIAVILSYALLYLSDRLWETPPAVGWLLFFIAVSGLAVFIPRWSFRWVWQRRTEAQLARLISRTDAALGDRLLGVIELDSEKHGRQYGSEKLKKAAMEQVAREVSARDLTVNIPRPSHRKLFVLLAVLAACTAAVCAVSPEAGRECPETLGPPVQSSGTLYIHPAGPHPGFPGHSHGRELPVRNPAGGGNQNPPADGRVFFPQQGEPASASCGRRIQDPHPPHATGGQPGVLCRGCRATAEHHPEGAPFPAGSRSRRSLSLPIWRAPTAGKP